MDFEDCKYFAYSHHHTLMFQSVMERTFDGIWKEYKWAGNSSHLVTWQLWWCYRDKPLHMCGYWCTQTKCTESCVRTQHLQLCTVPNIDNYNRACYCFNIYFTFATDLQCTLPLTQSAAVKYRAVMLSQLPTAPIYTVSLLHQGFTPSGRPVPSGLA